MLMMEDQSSMNKKWIWLIGILCIGLTSCKTKPPAEPQSQAYDSTQGSVYDDNGSGNNSSSSDDLESSGVDEESQPLTYSYNDDDIESEQIDQFDNTASAEGEHLDWGPIYFSFDAADLTDEARRKLSERARYIVRNPGLVVLIEGHCDSRGTEDYNLALGERRSQAVKQYLQELGVPANSLNTISYGERRPEVEGENESAWRRNRRVTFAF